jgi:hypothetical protein
MRKRTSKIWQISKTDLQLLVNKSNSIVEILKTLGLKPYSGNHRTLHKRIQEDKICLNQLETNRHNWRIHFMQSMGSKYSINNKDIFCKNSKYSNNSQIKKKIINEYGILEQCSICQTGNIWNNEPLSLQLDHINGINNDHRLENLRLLCPNCHSQTETFSGKRKKTQQKQCKKCSQPISDKKFAKFCESCRTKEKQKNYIKRSKFNPNKEELTNVLKSNNWNYSATGRHYNVSDNSIRKKCKKLNITKEGRNSAN